MTLRPRACRSGSTTSTTTPISPSSSAPDKRCGTARTAARSALVPPRTVLQHPVTIHEVADGRARVIHYSKDLFTYGKRLKVPAHRENLGFAGFRVGVAPDFNADMFAFLGASYFRAVGGTKQYGLSARGLADRYRACRGPRSSPTSASSGSRSPTKLAPRCVIHALLDSPSVAGAYTFVVTPGDVDRHGGGRHAVSRARPSSASASRRSPRCSSAARTTAAWPTTGARKSTIPTACPCGTAPANGSGGRCVNPHGRCALQLLPRREPEGLRPDAARRGLRPLPGRRRDVPQAPVAVGGAAGRLGQGPGPTGRDSQPRRDLRQHRRLLESRPSPSARPGAAFPLPPALGRQATRVSPMFARVVSTRLGVGGIPGEKNKATSRKFVLDFKGGRFEQLPWETRWSPCSARRAAVIRTRPPARWSMATPGAATST